jgi:hypothetical protein
MTAPGGPNDPGTGPTPVPTLSALRGSVWRWLLGLWWAGVRWVVG